MICELQEEGVSGHKVRAEKRDKIQTIKSYALEHKFDILLVFMFDRIGRISDETPFVVEWFAQHDIRIWSAVEGEQKFESHVDKLTNYIRYWQADGESRKTAERVANSMAILTSEGCYTGGGLLTAINTSEPGVPTSANRKSMILPFVRMKPRLYESCLQRHVMRDMVLSASQTT